MGLLKKLSQRLQEDQILTGESVHQRITHVWETDKPLQAKAVVLPRNTDEVSFILKTCFDLHQPVVIHGGLTNLVGSTQSQEDQLVISLERMNRILEVDPQTRTMTVEAGVILENIQAQAQAQKMLFPLNFGAKGSAQIGGIISTNAGGLRVFRYGMTRELVLGLEAVLSDGRVVSSLKKIIKDNSGYDLKQLFIGSEGTLGIITQAVLRLYETPKSRTSALVAISDYSKVVSFLKYIDQGLAGLLSAFELIWNTTYKVLTPKQAPIGYQYPLYVLVEALGSSQAQDQERLFELLDTALTDGLIEEAVPATTPTEIKRMWEIREHVDNIVAASNYHQHFDISLPISHIGPVVEEIKSQLLALPEVDQVYPFGHVADGNIHMVVSRDSDEAELIQQINRIVYQPLKNIGGSISAEHGIGVDKKPYLELSRNSEELAVMKTLKKTLDPRNILNPGRVLD